MDDHTPKESDWGRIFAEAVDIASSFTKRDAEDLVQEAIELYWAGKAPWEASSGQTLALHLVNVGLKARSHKARTERRRRHPKVLAAVQLLFGGRSETPEERLFQAREEQRKRALFGELVAGLADDPQAREVVLLEEQGISDVAEQARRIGCDIEAVRNARKRVKRRVEALAKREPGMKVDP